MIDIYSNTVIYSANCGTISSGVDHFSIDEGLVPVTEGNSQVRIYNTNTKSVIVAQVRVKNGKAAFDGGLLVPGVPGAGAEISMNWAGTVGAKTGHLLPTGHAVDTVKLESGKEIEVSIVDACFGDRVAMAFHGSRIVGLSEADCHSHLDPSHARPLKRHESLFPQKLDPICEVGSDEVYPIDSPTVGQFRVRYELPITRSTETVRMHPKCVWHPEGAE